MRLPKHIAIIPDGNRRWAVKNQLQKQEGYERGLDPGLRVLRKAKEYKIPEITYYGFTTDNCKRPKVQQEAFRKACVDAVKMIENEGNVSLLVVGDMSSNNFPFTTDNCKRPKVQQEAFRKACVDAVKMIENEGNVSLLVVGDMSSNNFPRELCEYRQRKEIGTPEIKVNFLVNYGWEWDLGKTVSDDEGKFAKRDVYSADISRIDLIIRWGNMRRLSSDDEGKFAKRDVYSADISRIDLIIRWGNMRRLSGMLPIQSVYADFYVVEELWPDYQDRDFEEALRWYDKQDVTLGG